MTPTNPPAADSDGTFANPRLAFFCKIIAVGLATLLVACGWFVEPSTTMVIQVDDKKVVEIDLVSFGDAAEPKDATAKEHPGVPEATRRLLLCGTSIHAKGRAKAITLFAGVLILLWWGLLAYAARSRTVAGPLLRWRDVWPHVCLGAAATLLTAWLILDIVDVWEI